MSLTAERVSRRFGKSLALRTRLSQRQRRMRRDQDACKQPYPMIRPSAPAGAAPRGFSSNRKGACVAIQVPLTHTRSTRPVGSGWECDRSYTLKGRRCDPVIVPANGYLTTSRRWLEVHRGFARSANACVQIEAPSNGYVDEQGNGWACERGFQADSACAQIKVPANAHLEYSGNAWRCDRGFLNRNGTCVAE